MQSTETAASSIQHFTRPPSPAQDKFLYFNLGFCMAIVSSILIGFGLVCKKRALLQLARNGHHAADGSLSYLRSWLWWTGLGLLGLGESVNFAAYMFAPAILVTPLGGLSVPVCALASSKLLRERFNCLGKLGCLLCLLGSTVIVLHAPKEQLVNSLNDVFLRFVSPAFLVYMLSVLVSSLVLICLVGPRCGKTNPLVYTLVSGSIGSLSVIACKGLGIGIKYAVTVSASQVINSTFFWFLLTMLVTGIVVQLHFLNRALDLFNAGLVTAILYVVFTGCVVLASGLLFGEWSHGRPADYVELGIGLLLITIGVWLMTLFSNVAFDWQGTFVAQLSKTNPNLVNGEAKSGSLKREHQTPLLASIGDVPRCSIEHVDPSLRSRYPPFDSSRV